MTQIIPAILEQNPQELARKVKILSQIPGVTRVHLDFADGDFVPNSTLELGELEPLNPEIFFEAHLMIRSPKDFFDLKLAGVKCVIVHAESYLTTDELRAALQQIIDEGMEPGLSLKLDSSLELAVAVKDLTKHIQLMSIEPGFMGSPFNEKVFDRITELRNKIPDAVIEVDGGVSIKNAARLADSGANLLVSGSGIWNGDPKKNFEILTQEVALY